MTTVRSVVVKLKADISDFNREMLAAAAGAKALPDSLAASGAKARGELSSLERELQKIAAGRYDASVVLEDQEAAARLDELHARLEAFGTTVSDARVDVDVHDAEANARISAIESGLLALANTTADPNINLQGVAKAEAQLTLLQAHLDSIGSGSGGGGLRGFLSELDDSNDRMSNLIQTAVALGPALIPVTAGAAVAVGGLTSSLTLAAAGAGVMAMALNGVGEALDALGTYRLKPTDEHLAALQAKLEALGPAGQEFTFFLEDLQPKLAQLNDTAEAGFLPGLQDGITSLMQQFPVVQGIVGDLSSTLGDLAAESGEALNSPFWDRVLDTFTRDASDALSTISEAVGHVIQGFTGMFLAFEPVGMDFSHELESLSEDFDRWGQGLGDNSGFQDFVAYARENGPAVADALAAITDALVAVVEAGAPVGQALLPVITGLANGFADIARSPAGPVLFSVAAGLSALGRSMALLKALNAPLLIGGIQKLGGPEMTGQAARLRALGAAIGVLGLSLTDLDDKAGLSNTLTGAALGSIAGPWGAAIGGAIGFTRDLAAENDNLADSMKAVDASFGSQTLNLQGQAADLQSLAQELSDYEANLSKARGDFGLDSGFMNPLDRLGDVKTLLGEQLTGADQEGFDLLNERAQDLGMLTDELNQFRNALAGLPQDSLGAFTTDLGELQATADKAFPILDKAGFSIERVQRLLETHAGREVLAQAIFSYNDAAKAASGGSNALKAALDGLDDPLTTAADKAAALQSAISDLFTPQMDLEAATDAWITSLRTLSDDLDKSSKTLDGNSNAAITNRAAIRERVDAMKAVLEAQAAVDPSAEHLTETLKSERGALINAAEAAGISRTAMKQLINTYGLTPSLVKTLIKLYGAEQAEASIRSVQAFLDSLHDKTVTITTREVHVLTTLSQMGGGPGGIYGANGMILERMANGGFPAIGDQAPQIQPNHGARGITWAETGAGPWEAFISGHPAKKDRSRSIADETVGRLGGTVQWMADGGFAQKGNAALEAIVNGARAQRGPSGWSSAPAPSVTPAQLETAVNRAVNGAKFVLDVGSQQTLKGTIRTEAADVVDGHEGYNARQRRARP